MDYAGRLLSFRKAPRLNDLFSSLLFFRAFESPSSPHRFGFGFLQHLPGRAAFGERRASAVQLVKSLAFVSERITGQEEGNIRALCPFHYGESLSDVDRQIGGYDILEVSLRITPQRVQNRVITEPAGERKLSRGQLRKWLSLTTDPDWVVVL